VKVTREGVTTAQKAQIIREVTDVIVRVLDKDPQTTFVVIEEVDTDNWGVAGETTSVRRKRAHERKAAS
jgi:4-oxalocrotonate tautomerase